MRITVIGGGNIGTLIAGQCSANHHEVTVYTRDISRWSNTIEVIDHDTNQSITTTLEKITSNLYEAVKNADLIFTTLPAYANQNFVKELTSLDIKPCMLCFYPGLGGIEFYTQELVKKGFTIFGTQRVCSVARLKEYGHSVTTAGKRKHMYVAAIPSSKTKEMASLFSSLFDIETTPLPNYINVTLTPSNPILHTTRLYSLFKDYVGQGYKELPLFYENWDNESSKLLIACDTELQNICKSIQGLDTSYVNSLLNHYESTDYKTLTAKITSIESFKGLTTPSIENDGLLYPDFNSRYFTADFPYGLVIVKAFALLTKTNTPNIDLVLDWYQRATNQEFIKDDQLGKDCKVISIPQNYGIHSLQQLENLYRNE